MSETVEEGKVASLLSEADEMETAWDRSRSEWAKTTLALQEEINRLKRTIEVTDEMVTDEMVEAGLKVLIDARTKPDWPSGAEVVRRIILAALAARR